MNKIRGSEWRRWDLHFHTPSSYDYKDKSITNQQIIDNLVSNNISVVAITDHHTIDIERISELQKLGREKNITVLPGIEFLSDARGDEPIHFIAIFSDSMNINHIWKQIESKTNLHKIESEKKQHNEVYCDLLDTIKLIKDLGGIVSIHAGKKSNSIENITNSLDHGVAQKIDIAEAIDIFEIGKESDQSDYNKFVIPFLKKSINKHIPMIICSDNHEVTKYQVKQNLWIKSDPTFEGLKQIIYEPEHRVKIQKDEPDFKEDRLVVEEIKFISSNNMFPITSIHLNRNLNVIIGGKSSGKSILLYNIAKALLADKSFLIKEKIEDKYDFKIDDGAFNFEVKTKGGFSQLMYRDIDDNSIIPEIKYIPQNYLIKLAEPDKNKTGNALNKIIRDLINEDTESQQVYNNFVSIVKANDRKREGLIDNYFDIKDKIDFLESQLQLKTNNDILDKNIASNNFRVEELSKSAGLGEDQLIEYNKLQTELEENGLQRTRTNNDYKKIKEFNKEAYDTLSNLKNRSNLISNSLENEILKKQFDDEYVGLGNLIKQLDLFISLFEFTKDESTGANKFKKESSISALFGELSSAKKAIEDKLKPYLKSTEIKEQIEVILKSISDDKTSLQAIDQLKKELSNNKIELQKEKGKLFKLYEENYNAYLNVIEELKSRTLSLEKDMKIQGIVKFNFPKFRKSIMNVSDGRKASYTQFDICRDSKDSLADYDLPELISNLNLMFTSIVERQDYKLNSKAGKKAAIKILFEDYFFDYWQIEYKGDKLGKMSTGKASFIILMLIVGLSKSKAPILIDQPEDNLDNRSITSDLVEYLKIKKLERQIILVTHNANIVVNADAENVIIANQRGQGDIETTSPFQFDYINGALENTFALVETENDLLKSMGIREHIADIVEGGKEAFKKREEKYGFKPFK